MLDGRRSTQPRRAHRSTSSESGKTVSTTVSGIPEAVDDGVTGLLVEPEDAAALTRALERLAADPDLCRDMGQAGQRLVRERFAIDHICAAYLELWQRLLAPPSR